MAGTKAYFAERGLEFDSAPAETSLLGSTVDSRQGITYSSLYETFTHFVMRVAKILPFDQQSPLMRGSTAWLPHAHATRAAESGAATDIFQKLRAGRSPNYRAVLTGAN